MSILAASVSTGSGGTRTLLGLAFLAAVGGLIHFFFKRRIGGPDGGSEKASVGAWILLAAIFIGILVSTRGTTGPRLLHHPQGGSSVTPRAQATERPLAERVGPRPRAPKTASHGHYGGVAGYTGEP